MNNSKKYIKNNPKLLAEWHYKKNVNCNLDELTLGSGKKVWWICDKGHEYQATIYNRSNGTNCPICSNKKILIGFNDLETTNPELAKEWNYKKNDNLTPKMVTTHSDKKAWWICKVCNHTWEAAIKNRSNGRGCPNCAKTKRVVVFNKTIVKQNGSLETNNSFLCSQWHPTKNGNLKPSMVTSNSDKKVWWKCKDGHEWIAKISNRSKGKGCPYCSNQKVLEGYNDLESKSPELALQWHKYKNLPITPSMVTTSSSKKFWWICDKGHEWESSVDNRSKGYGCPYCSGHKIIVGENDLLTTNPEIANEWHPTKNGSLLPSSISKGAHKKVWWKCSLGHEWIAPVYSRLNNGCPICSSESRTSFPEQVLFYYLKQCTKAENRYQIYSNIEIDIYLPLLKIGVEYDGWYFHNDNASKLREKNKNKILNELGITLFRIKEIKNNSYPIKSNTLFCNAQPSDQDLKNVIEELIEKINSVANTTYSINIDVSRDRANIYSQYIDGIKNNSLFIANPSIAAQWHPTKNGKLTPLMVTANSNKKVWWICNNDHEWKAIISSRNRGNGCPYCSGRNSICGITDLATKRPNLIKEWHPTKNGNLTPKDFTEYSNRKVWWICNNGHEYQTTIDKKSRGFKCPICKNDHFDSK